MTSHLNLRKLKFLFNEVPTFRFIFFKVSISVSISKSFQSSEKILSFTIDPSKKVFFS